MAQIVEDYSAILAYLDSPSSRWNAFTDLGTSVVITYSFYDTPDLPPGSSGSYGVDTFSEFTAFQRAQMRSVIDEAAEVAGIVFVEVESGGGMINMLSGSNSEGASISASGYAYYPGAGETWTSQSDLVMIYQDFTAGTFTYQVLLHELGHALGLSHTHTGDTVLEEEHDHNENSVMTYNWSWDHMTKYGVMDQEALTHLYGGAGKTRGFETRINDAGEIIVILSNRDDKMITADRGGHLIGRDGHDTLYGREGEDRLVGNEGGDYLEGGLGDDRLFGNRGWDKLVGDREDIWGGGDDQLLGGRGRDALFGNRGQDDLRGNMHDDRLFGGDGDDILRGGFGNDRLFGGGDDDTLTGGSGADRFIFTEEDRWDRDTITDFERGIDTLDLSRLGVTSAEDIVIRDSDGGIEIYVSAHYLTIQIDGVTTNNFTLQNIHFLEIA